MTRRHDIPSIFAVILPVSLGLGLIYLSATGRIEPMAALMVILGIAALVPLAVIAAKNAREERLVRSYEGYARASVRD